MPTRRTFLAASTLAALAPTRFLAQLPQAPTTRPNIVEIDHDRILIAAAIPAVPGDLLTFTQSVPALAAATLVDPANTPRYTANAAAQLKAFFITSETRLPATPPTSPSSRCSTSPNSLKLPSPSPSCRSTPTSLRNSNPGSPNT